MAPPTINGLFRRRIGLAALAGALVLAACGVETGVKAGAGSANGNPDVLGSEDVTTTVTAPPTTLPPPDIDIAGDDGSEINDIAANAITDLEAWWADAYPEAYEGEEYEPLSGGLFAVDSSTDPDGLPCDPGDVQYVLQNAYYCGDDDAVVWDQEGLMPDLASRYGDFTVAVVLAHEWGHAIQDRASRGPDPDLEGEPTVVTELQADCFAGAWVRHVVDKDGSRFEITTQQLDDALAGILSLRDAPGSAKDDPNAHGSGFDRVGAFQDGFEEDVTRCAEYTEGDPDPYQFEFFRQDDLDNNGDLPLQGDGRSSDDPGILDLLFPVLDDYWTDAFPEISGGDDWDPLTDPISFTSTTPPDCNGSPVADFSLFVCIPDRYVAYDLSAALEEPYDRNGDFAVAALIATQYGLDIDDQLGGDDTDQVTAILRGDCYAGSWSAAMLPDEEGNGDYELVLSPGDLDEAVAVLLSGRSETDRSTTGPGFDRVKAFRAGVVRGAESCAEIGSD